MKRRRSHIHTFLDSQEIAITTEQRADEIPIDINASTQDNRVNNPIQDREASGMDLNPQATIFESAAATSRSVQQQPPAEQHRHANAPTESNGNEIVGPSLIQSQLTAITKLLEIQGQNQLPLPEPGIFSRVMNELIGKGYAERVPEHKLSNESNAAWYIPHHGIYHPQKPDKLLVVFDCSASYHGESLNNHLLQGPDLTSELLGVLCRFGPRTNSILVRRRSDVPPV